MQWVQGMHAAMPVWGAVLLIGVRQGDHRAEIMLRLWGMPGSLPAGGDFAGGKGEGRGGGEYLAESIAGRDTQSRVFCA